MTSDEIRTVLFEVLSDIAPEADPASIRHDVSLRDQLDIDSMDFLNLMTALHDETGVEVPERDYPLLATIGGFVDYVARCAPSGARSGSG
jgi:acyl carrier protein